MVDFEKNKIYSRKECVNKIRNENREPGQGAYFSVRDKFWKIHGKVIFINKESIYDDELRDEYSIFWNDSIGSKAEPGEDFLTGKVNIYVFHEFQHKPKRYCFIGVIKKSKRILIGNKHTGNPNKYILEMKNKIPKIAIEAFNDPDSFQKSREIRENALNSSFGVVDPVKAEWIGKTGEKIFNDTIKGKYFYDDLIEFIKNKNIHEYLWENEDKETFKPYDFKINGRLYDVKTTITNSERFYVSSSEYELIKNSQLNIVLIWLDRNMNFRKHKIIASNNVSLKYNFKAKNYIASIRN